MDHLQLELGIVADEAITIDDCASRDLIHALSFNLALAHAGHNGASRYVGRLQSRVYAAAPGSANRR